MKPSTSRSAKPRVALWQVVVHALLVPVGLFIAYVAMLGRGDPPNLAIGLFLAVFGLVMFVVSLVRYRNQPPG